MAVLLSLQGKIARNEEKISAIREQNPQINALAFGTSTTKGNTSGSGSAPECRVAVPDAAPFRCARAASHVSRRAGIPPAANPTCAAERGELERVGAGGACRAG